MKVNLPKEVRQVLDLLNGSGYKAYIVGGYIRNFLLKENEHCYDLDITTNALSAEVFGLFKKNADVLYKCKETEEFGAVKVSYKKYNFDITTLRKESNYKDFRHPSDIEYVFDIHDDLPRRDFTINAVAYNENEGFIDDFGGINDIGNGILRTIGDPKKRFSEDNLRILRALRFLSTYDLTCEKNTEQSIISLAKMTKNISQDRINEELCKIIIGKNAHKVFNEFREVFFVIIPELKFLNMTISEYNISVFDIIVRLIKSAKSIIGRYCSLIVFFSEDIAKNILPTCKCEYNCEDICKKYISDKALKKNLKSISDSFYLVFGDIDDYEIKKALLCVGDNIDEFIDFFNVFAITIKEIFNIDLTEKAKRFEMRAKKIIENGECISLKQLALNGKTLLSLGYKGQKIAKSLEFCLYGVMSGKVENEEKELLKFLIENEKKNFNGL